MITNISRQLTTGALAIAGSVAAFGFANTAPVQAQVDCLPQSFNNFKTNPCRKGDKLFTHINSSGIGINDPANFLTITETVLPLGDLHTFTFTPATPLTSLGGDYVIDYTIEIIDDPDTPNVNELLTKMFEAFSAGYTTTGQTDSGVSLSKTVWSDAFGGSSLVGTSEAKSSDIGGIGSPGLTVPIAPNILKLYVRDTFSVSDVDGSLNSITNDFRQKSIGVPEPSAILGILAVAGVGAFARRKS
ncbi:PEP-CTERM sorting domain-containing protein [Microcystis sp. M061S2]|uniref:PEP-CTERM sorting domain-containing protein n=1 Tax=Microcystis sp. M061S2 TaxID=2771171 RepID=UPI00258BFDC1|nr:PEP-CTERM sorting domain-containing protein [Microcystis sp. M061S2]MCA2654436.1 PEP-CTERM sorting domain-containing protein [Microcystis sp. M061S2]